MTGGDQADDTRIMYRLSFTEVYKQWRNRARKYDRASILISAIDVLWEPSPDLVTELGKFPWLTLLMVKWVCQDRYLDGRHLPQISRVQLDDLRQRLLEFPERLHKRDYETTPLPLFMRQLIRPQLGFQRSLTSSFAREAAILADQCEDYPLRELVKVKTGIDVCDFIDLSIATYSAIGSGKHAIDDAWFGPLRTAYGEDVVSSFQTSLSRTFPELIAFCRSLPDANHKVASEYFEFPSLTRYPFLRTGDTIVCWHPTVLYRGLETFVHSVLSEEGQQYMRPYSRLFEQHVVAEAKRIPAQFVDENMLRGWISSDTRVPDGLLSFPGCNVFVESKAGLFHESVMAVGNNEMFAHKTKAIRNAVRQAWATAESLRRERRAPTTVLDAQVDYLLIVTNKELGASRGSELALMYPEGTLDYPNADAEKLLPRNRIYVLAIDDFERLTNAAASGRIKIPVFLASCVDDDSTPDTALHLFEQHLDKRRVPKQFSRVVEKAVAAGFSRLEAALNT